MGVVLLVDLATMSLMVGRFLDGVIWFAVLATALAVSSLVLEVWDTIEVIVTGAP